jgi:glutaminase
MVNAGAIMISALLMEKEPSLATRYKSMMNLWKRLFGGKSPTFSNATFLSEKEKCDRNWCLAYMMKDAGAFPTSVAGDLKKILDFYFQSCSIEASVDNMAMLAATLANGGVCPITSDRIFHSKTVRHGLSLLLSCGMYDYSGEWQFLVGLPAKSGVGGCVFITVPGILGMAIYSPRLDKNGNSARAVEFAQMLGQRFRIHMFSNLPCHDEVSVSAAQPGSPERQRGQTETDAETLPQQPDLLERRHQTSRHIDIVAMLFAAASGDLNEIQRLVGKGISVRTADYDLRTILHVAASEGASLPICSRRPTKQPRRSCRRNGRSQVRRVGGQARYALGPISAR